MKQSMDKMSLGDRMKNYEKACKTTLPMRMPVIMRLDGRSFHTLTRKLEKPFDTLFIDLMHNTMKYLCENISGAVFAYTQSDEISILIHNYKKLNTQAWFGNEIQKMVSISAGLASAYFSVNFKDSEYFKDIPIKTSLIQFDSRVFLLPESEVCNYFIWRQQDWERNSVQMLTHSLYSQKEMHKQNINNMQEMCFKKGKNWNDLPVHLKRGTGISKEFSSHTEDENTYERSEWVIDKNIPIFTKNREYVDKFLEVTED